MSYWNHRVIKHTKTTVIGVAEETETWHAIHEVFYDDAGHPNGYTENEVSPFGETLLELSEDIKRFADALSKPVLVHEDFFPARNSIHARDVEPLAVEADRLALNEIENAAWMALGGKDTRAEDNVKALLTQMLDGYDAEHGVNSRKILDQPNIGTSSSADELIAKFQVEPVATGSDEKKSLTSFKVFPAPSDSHTEAAQREPGTEIPCPFCKGRVLPRKEWLTGTWCCDKQYKARGLQRY